MASGESSRESGPWIKRNWLDIVEFILVFVGFAGFFIYLGFAIVGYKANLTTPTTAVSFDDTKQQKCVLLRDY
jgi:hypothetical protein